MTEDSPLIPQGYADSLRWAVAMVRTQAHGMAGVGGADAELEAMLSRIDEEHLAKMISPLVRLCVLLAGGPGPKNLPQVEEVLDGVLAWINAREASEQ